MDYVSLLNSKIGEIPKPGLSAQLKMAPPPRFDTDKSLPTIPTNVRYAAVMLLLYPADDGALYFCLIQRTTYAGKHSGQISLPGGKKEKNDSDFWATALRETQEEIGIDPKQVKLITSLSSTYIPPSNFYVYPYLAVVDHRPIFSIEKKEVDHLIEIPITDLLNDQSMTSERVETSYMQPIDVPVFLFHPYRVWGATAMILAEAREMILLAK